MSDEKGLSPQEKRPATSEAGPPRKVDRGAAVSERADAPRSAASGKPVKKRTSSTRRRSSGSAKAKPKPKPTTAASAVAAMTPAEPAGMKAAASGPVEAAVPAVAEALAEGAATGAPAKGEEPEASPLVSQWLSRPLSATAEERLERMRRTVPGYRRPSKPVVTALRALSWLLFAVLAAAVVTTLLGALDRTMETTLVGGAPAQQAAQIIPAQEGQKVRVVNAAGVNLRSQPRQGVTFVMVRLKKGTMLTLLASKPGEPAWFKVRPPTGESGWVVDDKSYTQLIEAPK